MTSRHATIAVGAVFLSLLLEISSANELPHVCVVGKSEDMVGNRLVYNVKELIRKSASMKLMPSEGQEGCLRLIIQTIDLKVLQGENVSAAYSVTWTVSIRGETMPYYVDGVVGYCGANRVSETAENIVAQTEKIVSAMTRPSAPSAP